jgi:type IV pilus assembly protein PilW
MNRFPRPQSGFSLVELMIAVAIGLFITGVVIVVFAQNRASFTQDQTAAEMQENGRYAIDVLAHDLAMTGFWGEMLSPAAIDTTNVTITADKDCGESGHDNWAYDVDPSLQSSLAPADPSTEFKCISSDEHQGGTDVLVVKRIRGTPATGGEKNQVYLRTNGTAGSLFECDHDTTCTNAPAIGTAQNWPYIVNIYYVRRCSSTDADGNCTNSIPSLYRKILFSDASTAPQMRTEDGGVAEGIESFHIQFGIDSSGDGTANFYVSGPTAAQLEHAVSARIYVLVRSRNGIPGYVNNKKYVLGDLDLGVLGGNFYRRVYSTTVMLRNPAYLSVFPK